MKKILSTIIGSFWLLSSISIFAQTKLNVPLSFGQGVEYDFVITSDDMNVIYRADQDTKDVIELYNVSINGGTPTKLNATLVSGGNVKSFKVSGDGARVIYKADQDNDEVYELYSVPVTGGTPVKLTGPMVSGGDLLFDYYWFTPDNTKVIYISDEDTDNANEMFVVPVTGGTPLKLNPNYAAGRWVSSNWSITSDGQTIVYVADQNTDNVFEMFKVSISGGATTKLSGTMYPNKIGMQSFEISPDDAYVIYRAYIDEARPDIYSVPLSGGASTRLSPTSTGHSNGVNTSYFKISPNSQTVVFASDPNIYNQGELFSIPINGGTPTKISGTLFNGSVSGNFQITSDNSTVFYLGNQDGYNKRELFKVSIGGGPVVKMNTTTVSGGTINGFLITPDDNTLVYYGDQDTDGVNELYQVPVLGGTPTKINAPLISGGTVTGYKSLNNSSGVIYKAIQETLNQQELYYAPLNGGSINKISGEFAGNGNVVLYSLTSNDSTVVFTADLDSQYVRELHSNSLFETCSFSPECSPLPEATGLYTADTAVTDANGFTHYLDNNENLLLSIKVPSGWTIPANAVSLKIGATPVSFYTEHCGGTPATGCFISNINGAPVLNRSWNVNSALVTAGPFAFIEIKYYFTDAEYNALNTELTNQGVSTMTNYTDMQMYQINDPLNAFGSHPTPNLVTPWNKANIMSHSGFPTTINWNGSSYNGVTPGYSAHFQVFNFNGGGGMGGIMR